MQNNPLQRQRFEAVFASHWLRRPLPVSRLARDKLQSSAKARLTRSMQIVDHVAACFGVPRVNSGNGGALRLVLPAVPLSQPVCFEICQGLCSLRTTQLWHGQARVCLGISPMDEWGALQGRRGDIASAEALSWRFSGDIKIFQSRD